jgi:diguanylate cyclase (GGDEF)-like protein
MTHKKSLKKIILHNSGNVHYNHLKQILSDLNIGVYEADVFFEVNKVDFLEDVAIALAIVDEVDTSGIDFLRSTMISNHLIQRMMLCASVNIDLFELAINKAHINYLIKLPLEKDNILKYLRKADRRYQDLTRIFSKYDILSEVTQDLLLDNERYRHEAEFDALTKLMNRRSFNSIIKRMWQRFKEHGVVFSLALIDIDDFKNINDTYGHSAGDEALKTIAGIILNNQRMGLDYAFRYGGDEFTIISTGSNHKEMIKYLQRILSLVRCTIYQFNDHKTSITISAGVCQTIFDESPEALIDHADQALYIAKESGRDQVIDYMADKE